MLSILPFGVLLEERFGLDLLFRLRGARPAPSEVLIIGIDKASAEALGLPDRPQRWPRALHARLTDALSRAGAAVIAFDVFFDEPRSDRDDAAFASAIRNAGNVVLFENLRRESIRVSPETNAAELNVETLLPPLPALASAAAGLAPFPLPKAPVGLAQYWAFRTASGEAPAIPAVVFQVYALDAYDDFARVLRGVRPSVADRVPESKSAVFAGGHVEQLVRTLREIFQRDPSIAEEMADELRRLPGHSETARRKLMSLVSMYRGGESRYLNLYGPPGTITTLPYSEALRRDEEPDGLSVARGKAVFVGASDQTRTEQKDGFYTVFSQPNGLDISGVEIAATAFGNLVEDMPVRPLAISVQMASVFISGAVLGMMCGLSSTPVSAAGLVLVSTLYLLGVRQRFGVSGAWYPVVHPLLVQVPLAFVGAILWRYAETDRERKRIRAAFGYYLPGDAVDRIVAGLETAGASARVVYGTCLATDVERYTALAERTNPQQLARLMNAYYSVVFEPIKRHGGVVLDVIGDSALAVWTTAQPDAALRRQACEAACDLLKAVDRFNREVAAGALPTRIGLHFGEMLIGDIGSRVHYGYRATGDTVNTTTRIQGLNKYLGTWVLVSADVLEGLDGFLTREVGTFLLVGKSKPLMIYELICRVEDASEEQRALCRFFAESLRAYRQQTWDDAIRKCEATIRIRGEDGPSSFYVTLCEGYLSRPPGPDWTGVVRMDEK